MARYIDADALKEVLTEKVFHNLTDEFYGTMQALDEAPAADVAPVKRGKWESDKEPYGTMGGCAICSECGKGSLSGAGGILPSYCWNCGAQMEANDHVTT